MRCNPSDYDRLRSRFAAGDEVVFPFRRGVCSGRLIRTNPRRAVVRVKDAEYTVPYEMLETRSPEAGKREQRVVDLYRSAVSLFQEHGLRKWSFRLDDSSRRAGCCNYRDRVISISLELVRSGNDDAVRDTLLHEMAHALVGKKHNHDPVWRAKALELGCSGERTHRLQFAPPRWKVVCENACWSHTAERRNPRLVCRRCGGRLVYTSLQAWSG